MKIMHTTDVTNKTYLDAVSIRKTVFINEQGVPKELELDDYENKCIYLVLYSDKDEPIATCRLLPLNNDTVKLQRMAVKKEFRGQAYGRLLIEEAEKIAKEKGYQIITLGAQITALGFYERLGYKKYGELFLDAGIEHYQMDKTL
ncbi:GNAT family N-acetyltransferase [Enterococcus sp. LJL99]